MQICPEWKNAANAAASTAYSRSASASTISGLYPPSSSTHRLRWRPARSASNRPVAEEPVKLMHRTSGRSKNSSATGAASPGANVPGMSERMTSPTGRYPQLAACRSSRVAVSTWKPANAPAQPVSVASSAVISFWRPSTMSAARRNMVCLPAGGSCAQRGNAAVAASTARPASARVPAAIRAMTVPWYGSRSSNRRPELTHSPPMCCWYSRTNPPALCCMRPGREARPIPVSHITA
jgi:hypothetical protein